MSGFRASASSVIGLSNDLQVVYDDVGQAKLYAEAHGAFSFHEAGAMGLLFGWHAALMGQLDELFGRLSVIATESRGALLEIAHGYTDADEAAQARLDASYPATPRPTATRD